MDVNSDQFGLQQGMNVRNYQNTTLWWPVARDGLTERNMIEIDLPHPLLKKYHCEPVTNVTGGAIRQWG